MEQPDEIQYSQKGKSFGDGIVIIGALLLVVVGATFVYLAFFDGGATAQLEEKSSSWRLASLGVDMSSTQIMLVIAGIVAFAVSRFIHFAMKKKSSGHVLRSDAFQKNKHDKYLAREKMGSDAYKKTRTQGTEKSANAEMSQAVIRNGLGGFMEQLTMREQRDLQGERISTEEVGSEKIEFVATQLNGGTLGIQRLYVVLTTKNLYLLDLFTYKKKGSATNIFQSVKLYSIAFFFFAFASSLSDFFLASTSPEVSFLYIFVPMAALTGFFLYKQRQAVAAATEKIITGSGAGVRGDWRDAIVFSESVANEKGRISMKRSFIQGGVTLTVPAPAIMKNEMSINISRYSKSEEPLRIIISREAAERIARNVENVDPTSLF